MVAKKELVEKIYENGSFSTKKTCAEALDAVVQAIIDCVMEDGKVRLHGLGTFEIVERAERVGFNPQTGQKMTIDAKKALKFKASTTMKEAINE